MTPKKTVRLFNELNPLTANIKLKCAEAKRAIYDEESMYLIMNLIINIEEGITKVREKLYYETTS